MWLPIDIFGIKTIHDLRRLNRAEFYARNMTQQEFEHIAKLCQAFWLHSGNSADPHAELTSGKCSNGYIDTLRILRFTNLCEILARELVKIYESHPLYLKGYASTDWVVGSDHAGADFSHSFATWLGAGCNGTQHDFTEKGDGKSQLWKRFQIRPEETVLQVEELVTTLGTLHEVRTGIRAGHAYPVNFVPVVLTLVHRSPVHEFEGSPILYFAHYDVDVWEPEDCPLCRAGSKKVRPKKNWEELTRAS